MHGYLIDGAMVHGGYRNYRWAVYILTLLLREKSELVVTRLHCGTPERAPSTGHGYFDVIEVPVPDRAVKIGIFVLGRDWCRHKQSRAY